MINYHKIFAIIVLFLILLIFFGCSATKRFEAEDHPPEFVLGHKIVMIDPMLQKSGLRDNGDIQIEISLIEMGERYGYISADVLSAFIMTRGALDELWPGDSIPDRSDLLITTGTDTGVYRIVADILALNKDSPQAPKNWIVNDSLDLDYIYTIIFERKSTGKEIEMRWNSRDFIKKHFPGLSHYDVLKRKVLFGDATDEEIEEFRQLINRMIRITLSGSLPFYNARVLERH